MHHGYTATNHNHRNTLLIIFPIPHLIRDSQLLCSSYQCLRLKSPNLAKRKISHIPISLTNLGWFIVHLHSHFYSFVKAFYSFVATFTTMRTSWCNFVTVTVCHCKQTQKHSLYQVGHHLNQCSVFQLNVFVCVFRIECLVPFL